MAIRMLFQLGFAIISKLTQSILAGMILPKARSGAILDNIPEWRLWLMMYCRLGNRAVLKFWLMPNYWKMVGRGLGAGLTLKSFGFILFKSLPGALIRKDKAAK